MSLLYFLLITILSLDIACIVFADDSGKTCPYYGKKDPRVLKKLKSTEFRNSLSPFDRYYLDSMPSDDYFLKLHDVSFKPNGVYKAFFYECIFWLADSNVQCPTELCKQVAEKIEGAFKNNVSSLDYFLVIASGLKSIMKKAGKLDSSDEAATRKELKVFIEDVARPLCSPKVKTPKDALFALDKGTTVTLERWGLNNPKFVEEIEKGEADDFVKYSKMPVALN